MESRYSVFTRSSEAGILAKLLKTWSGRRGSNPRRPAWEDDSELGTKNVAFPGTSFWRLRMPSFHPVFRPGSHRSTHGAQRPVGYSNRLLLILLSPRHYPLPWCVSGLWTVSAVAKCGCYIPVLTEGDGHSPNASVPTGAPIRNWIVDFAGLPYTSRLAIGAIRAVAVAAYGSRKEGFRNLRVDIGERCAVFRLASAARRERPSVALAGAREYNCLRRGGRNGNLG